MMNFPLDNSLFRAIYWIINTPGIGGLIVVLLGGGLVSAFGYGLFWVWDGGRADEEEVYSFPTHSLLED